MKIGYPCINTSIGCTTNRTFRLANYSEERLIETVSQNLDCLQKVLEYNVANGFYFFRISSSIIPFASHPVNEFNWSQYFREKLLSIGKYIKKHNFRISMHPDQFVIINALKEDIIEKSISELAYHCLLLTAMELENDAKVQIHVGGVYGEKTEAINRFISSYKKLPQLIKDRLVIENDDRSFSLEDCMQIHQETGIPVLFDNLHHECLNNGESIKEAMEAAFSTWKKTDGIPMVDYSSQEPDERKGKHTQSIEPELFRQYIETSKSFDFDIMLEIKDKEKSAAIALKIARMAGKI